MNSNGNAPHKEARQRRVERYAGEFLGEPSMSAPQPIPGKSGKAQAGAKKPFAIPAEEMQNQPAVPAEAAPPVQEIPPVQQNWPQDAQGYPVQQGWSQPYPMQPVAEFPPQQGWQQPYPVQLGQEYVPQQGWSQPYQVQPGQEYAPQQGWSQTYPVQQGGEYAPQQGWSQPYPVQQVWPQQTSQAPNWLDASGYTPATAGNPAPIPEKQGGNGGGKNPWWKMALLAVLFFVVTSGVLVGGGAISRQNAKVKEVSSFNDRFCEGVYVDGIHLGGLTQDEAYEKVDMSAQSRLNSWHVDLTYGGQTIRSITASDLGMTVNVNDALAEAWEQGHQSSDVDERKTAMDMLLLEPYHGYTAIPSGDTSVVDRILHELAAPVYRLPQDATVTFIPDAHSYPFEYTPEVYGSYLNVEPIKAEIYAMVDNMESGSIELVPEVIAPGVTEADLRQQRTLRGTATTEISTTSTDERTGNIQRAFQLINGTVLKPGDTFSFNGIVGARTAKNGFLPAIEYAYGNERLGYGGGVCQASTTVYLAAVRADVTVTHREPHSDKVNYTEYGLDATVNYDGKKIDLTFKNTTGSDVYIMSYLERGKNRWLCRVDIYGVALPEGVTYELVAETVEVLPAPVDPEYVEDEDGTHVVYIDDKPVQKRKASDGYVVDTFKVKYLNGVEVERTYVDTDTYKAKAQQLWVGVQERDGW